jgi:hypothetical protein
MHRRLSGAATRRILGRSPIDFNRARTAANLADGERAHRRKRQGPARDSALQLKTGVTPQRHAAEHAQASRDAGHTSGGARRR